MNATNGDIAQGVLVAAITALFIALVLYMGKVAGRWLTKALAQTFGQQVVEVMAPDMARLGNRLGQSIDELRVANSDEHRVDREQMKEFGTRLAAVESVLGIRPTDARTRAGDNPETEKQ